MDLGVRDLISAGAVLAVGLGVAIVAAALINFTARRLQGDHKRAGRFAGGVFWFVLVVSALIAVGRLADPEATDAGLTAAVTRLLVRLPDVLIGLLVVIVGWLLAAAVRTIVKRVVSRVQPAAADVLSSLAFYAIVVLSVLIGADQIGIEVLILQGLLLLVIWGLMLALAIALGVGSRDLVSHLVAGRHVGRIVTVGDEITVGTVTGMVESVGPTSVRVAGAEGTIEIPNGHLLESPVTIR